MRVSPKNVSLAISNLRGASCAFPRARTLFARLCAVLGGRECPLSGVASEVCGERDSPSAPRAGALWWVVPGACARGHELKARRCGANEAGVCTGRAAARTARDQLTHLLILHISYYDASNSDTLHTEHDAICNATSSTPDRRSLAERGVPSRHEANSLELCALAGCWRSIGKQSHPCIHAHEPRSCRACRVYLWPRPAHELWMLW